MKNFEQQVEAGGNELPIFKMGALNNSMVEIIVKKFELDNTPGAWNPLPKIIGGMTEIQSMVGEMNLFTLGKETVNKAAFPPISDLKEAYESLDIAYHMNHRLNGEVMFNPETGKMLEGIGHYILTSYDATEKRATMKCHTPYPSKYEEGLLLQLTRKFKPEGSAMGRVELDPTQESRLRGGDSCTFIMTW